MFIVLPTTVGRKPKQKISEEINLKSDDLWEIWEKFPVAVNAVWWVLHFVCMSIAGWCFGRRASGEINAAAESQQRCEKSMQPGAEQSSSQVNIMKQCIVGQSA